MATFKPSKYQQAIFDWIETGSGSLVVEATAGSGKSTTAIKCLDLLTSKALFLAFNKSIADELREKAPSHADVLTLNSLGHRAWMRQVGRVTILADKTRTLVNDTLTEFEQRQYGPAIKKLVAIAKAHGLAPKLVKNAKGLIADTDEAWDNLIGHYDIELPGKATDEEYLTLIHLARRILTLSCESKMVIDFDDQIYFPIIFGVSPPKYPWVFVDEAQDLSPAQHRLVEMALTHAGRAIFIGDSFQAVYGFRGSDANSMKNAIKRFGASVLPLSICYRCPKSHIKMAQALVPQIEAADTAPEGNVIDYGEGWSAATFTNEDLIICRNSAPLVRAAYKILAQKVAVRILGRDLGTGLISTIRKLKPKNPDDLIEKLHAWREREIKKIKLKNESGNTDKIDDRFETIMTFLDMFPQASPEGICREIEAIYSDNTKGILTLCTIHKAKGLEANRVFVLNRNLMPSKMARMDWEKAQEKNLEFIALTRAKDLLGFIEIPKKKK